MTLAEMRASLRYQRDRMSLILLNASRENRDLTAEEKTRYDKFKAEAEPLERQYSGRVDALIQAEEAGLPPGGGGAGGQFASLGEFMHAVRFNTADRRLNYVENPLGDRRAEMRTDVDASGGFAIPPQFRATLLQVGPGSAIIRPRAQIIPAGDPPDSPITIPALDQTGAAPGNAFGGVQVQWIGEGATKPETDMKLRDITLTPQEVAGTITVTDKLLRNWQSASTVLETMLRGATAQAEDLAFLVGNGIGKPLGFLSSTATFRKPRLVANRVTYDDLVEMVARCSGSGVFVYARSMLPELMKLRDPEGRYIWVQSAREGEPAMLLGRPAVMSDRNPSLGSLGDIWLADLSHYLIKDGSGPFVVASPHVLFRQNKTVIKVFWNVDGRPWLKAPYQSESGYLVSPFVALDVPSA